MYLIATVGPNIKEKVILKGIINNGINVLRFNFAHGTEEEFKEFLDNAKDISGNIKILLDMSGSKIRVSNKFEYIYKIYDGEDIFFCGEDKYEELKRSDKKIKLIPLNINDKILHSGNYKMISIKDNTMNFNVYDKCDKYIRVKTINGGVVRRGKGCNIKDLDRSNINLSENDKKAIIWGLKNKIDIFCQSFVENRNNILQIKEYIQKYNNNKFIPKIWAKIETKRGVENIKEIVEVCDGIVIGRGDLIPETSIENVPVYEESIIENVKKYKEKELIIATHILNSMQSGKRPTICETDCIYNFIKKGVSGFLLAGETSVGRAPVKSVKFLDELIKKYSK